MYTKKDIGKTIKDKLGRTVKIVVDYNHTGCLDCFYDGKGCDSVRGDMKIGCSSGNFIFIEPEEIPPMDKLDILFIRACKTNNPEERLTSLYKRFYYLNVGDPKPYLINILARLCDKYCSFKTMEYINELSPENMRWHFDPKQYTFNEKSLKILISKIRMISVSDIPGFIKPAIFRDK